MKKTRKLVLFQYNCYNEMEKKLENYAKEGLILEKNSSLFWTFAKTEPQNLKYTVTYFKEGSIFNPDQTENHITYVEYAKASGWDLVCQNGQVQIFSNSQENPTPFDTDEHEKLKNIHACMKQSLIPSQLFMFGIILLNLSLRIPMILSQPTYYFTEKIDILCLFLFFIVLIFSGNTLINYFSWYIKSKKSVNLGGDILDAYSKPKRIFELLLLVIDLSLVGYIFYLLFQGTAIEFVVLVCMQMPILFVIYNVFIRVQKKLKISAKVNRIVSTLALALTAILSTAIIVSVALHSNFEEPTEKIYTTVEWESSLGESYEYRLYQDELPLTCEDLYGEIDFDEYSYKKNIEQTFLLTKEEFLQTAVPSENNPPEIEYVIYTTNFNWVSDLVIKELTGNNGLRTVYTEAIPSDVFGTSEAYTFYHLNAGEKSYYGEYVLIYQDKIVNINTEQQLTAEEIDVVNNKLQLK